MCIILLVRKIPANLSGLIFAFTELLDLALLLIEISLNSFKCRVCEQRWSRSRSPNSCRSLRFTLEQKLETNISDLPGAGSAFNLMACTRGNQNL